jgi:hypothetical protein
MQCLCGDVLDRLPNATTGYQSSKPIGSLTMSDNCASHFSRYHDTEVSGYYTSQLVMLIAHS